MTNRKAGWYWVQVFEGGQWGCFNWNGHAWHDHAGEYQEEIFDVVGPRIPTPDEPWQCVPVEPTEEMTKAGTWSGNGDVSVSEEWARKTVYGRMLSAAPKPGDL